MPTLPDSSMAPGRSASQPRPMARAAEGDDDEGADHRAVTPLRGSAGPAGLGRGEFVSIAARAAASTTLRRPAGPERAATRLRRSRQEHRPGAGPQRSPADTRSRVRPDGFALARHADDPGKATPHDGSSVPSTGERPSTGGRALFRIAGRPPRRRCESIETVGTPF